MRIGGLAAPAASQKLQRGFDPRSAEILRSAQDESGRGFLIDLPGRSQTVQEGGRLKIGFAL